MCEMFATYMRMVNNKETLHIYYILKYRNIFDSRNFATQFYFALIDYAI